LANLWLKISKSRFVAHVQTERIKISKIDPQRVRALSYRSRKIPISNYGRPSEMFRVAIRAEHAVSCLRTFYYLTQVSMSLDISAVAPHVLHQRCCYFVESIVVFTDQVLLVRDRAFGPLNPIQICRHFRRRT